VLHMILLYRMSADRIYCPHVQGIAPAGLVKPRQCAG
jgi:hypothetical protein